MSNNSTNNEVPMEDLFRDMSSDYSIPTDDKDLEDFMGQLDETGYFDKPKKRFIYFIYLAIFLLTASLSVYFFMSNKTGDGIKPPVVESNVYKDPELPSNQTVVEAQKEETPAETNEYSKDEPIKVIGKNDRTDKADKQVKQESVSYDSQLNSTVSKEGNKENVMLTAKDTITVITSQPKLTIDTIINQSSNITIKAEPKVIYRVVEKVDTVSVADTTRISKRKHEKLKNIK